jgi:plasmid stabilization system protein ParE
MISIEWTPEANLSFKNINSFLLNSWNITIQRQFIKLVDDAIDRIIENPISFQQLQKNKPIRKVIIHKNITLFYRYNESQKLVEILLFFDNRQNHLKLI